MADAAVWNPLKLDWRVEQAKADRLEAVYQRSGRADRSHPLHGFYTGLMAEAPSAQQTGDTAPSVAATPAGPDGAAAGLPTP